MIARIWRGWTKRADAKAYEEMLRNEIFPSIAARMEVTPLASLGRQASGLSIPSKLEACLPR